ncbi:MAG: nucleoside-triphosphatase [Desulfuromonas sp.]|nr:nucleoside-triphosphatase [Desulfuromonas sp.]
MLKHRLNEIWLKATVVGSLWACMEIVAGSFLHNLHLPFAGSILTALVIVFLVALQELWPDSGLVWRAGLICAAMKSISPGAVILGPMVAIVAEAILFSTAVRLCGRNFFGYLVGGCLTMAWLPVQKIGRMVIFYGSTVVDISLNALAQLQLHLGWSMFSTTELILIIVAVYPLLGLAAVACGWRLARRVRMLPSLAASVPLVEQPTPPPQRQNVQRSFLWLITHIVAIFVGLKLLAQANFIYGLITVIGYVLLCIWHYPGLYRRFKKTRFWLFFIGITLLAGMFLGGLSSAGEPFTFNFKVEHLLIGVQMNLRAALLLVAFSAFGVELGHPWIKQRMRQQGLGEYSLALEMAFAVMPKMMESLLHQKLKLHQPLRALAIVLQQLEYWRGQLCAPMPPLFILTGARGSGKTAALQMLVAQLQQQETKVAGVLSRGLWHAGQRSGFDVVDLGSTKSVPLCRVDTCTTQVCSGRFNFFATGLAFGQQALQPESVAAAELIVVDEIGPLELRGEGWAKQLDILLAQRKCPVVLSVRPSLVSRVIERWELRNVGVWQLEQVSVGDMLEQLGLASATIQPSKQLFPHPSKHAGI